MIKKGFIMASFIYLFNSLGNVSQGVFIKYYQNAISIGLYELITLKSLIAGLIMLPFAGKQLLKFKDNIKTLPIVIMLASLYALDVLTNNIGLKTVPVNTGTLILLLVPLWVILLGRVVLKETKFNVINAIAILVCLFAVFLNIKSEISFSGFNAGYLFLFADSLIIPLGLILQKKFSDFRPLAYAIFTNAVVLGIVSFFISGFNFPEMNIANLKAGFFVALFDLMEFCAVYVAYKMTDVALLQPIRYTRIVISVILSYFLLHETPTKYQLIAGFLIVSANAFSLWYSRKYQDNIKRG
jgi:drug/metabolite transporter (DMT)-like permease